MSDQLSKQLVFSPLANPAAIVSGPNVRFTVLTSRLLRLEESPSGVFEDRASQVFWFREKPVPPFSSKASGASIEIETEHLLLHYITNENGFNKTSLTIRLKEFGTNWTFGKRTRGNLGGTARTLDAHVGKMHLERGLISRDGWTVVDDSTSLVFNEAGWLMPRDHPQRDLYFFGYGHAFGDCIQDFTRLAGAVPMIPRYFLGNWWSRYWAYNQGELQALMEEFRANEVPLSICILDMDWHVTKTGNPSSGWTGYTWNRALFPDPPGFLRWLHSQGLKTALNLHPAKGVYPHEDQYPEMRRWMGMESTSQDPIPFDPTDPHFMEGYFKILHHPQEEIGIDFWWMDWQQGRKSKTPGS